MENKKQAPKNKNNKKQIISEEQKRIRKEKYEKIIAGYEALKVESIDVINSLSAEDRKDQKKIKKMSSVVSKVDAAVANGESFNLLVSSNETTRTFLDLTLVIDRTLEQVFSNYKKLGKDSSKYADILTSMQDELTTASSHIIKALGHAFAQKIGAPYDIEDYKQLKNKIAAAEKDKEIKLKAAERAAKIQKINNDILSGKAYTLIKNNTSIEDLMEIYGVSKKEVSKHLINVYNQYFDIKETEFFEKLKKSMDPYALAEEYNIPVLPRIRKEYTRLAIEIAQKDKDKILKESVEVFNISEIANRYMINPNDVMHSEIESIIIENIEKIVTKQVLENKKAHEIIESIKLKDADNIAKTKEMARNLIVAHEDQIVSKNKKFIKDSIETGIGKVKIAEELKISPKNKTFSEIFIGLRDRFYESKSPEIEKMLQEGKEIKEIATSLRLSTVLLSNMYSNNEDK